MSIALHNLTKSPAKKKKKRIGRGDSSGHGTYAGRGLKGQRSRSGGKKGITRRGLKQTLKGIPKKRGFKSFFPKMAIVNLDVLNKKFREGEKVDLNVLVKKNILKYSPRGLKVLGQGKISKKLNISAQRFSKKAKEAILKAGGEAKVVK